MGDFRASIKITFEMLGVKKDADMWINWSADLGEVDQRIIEFFDDAVGEAKAGYYAGIAAAEKKDAEEEERREYERLKSKFEPSPPTP